MLLTQGLQLSQFFFEGDFVHVTAMLNGAVVRFKRLLAAALGLLRSAPGRLSSVLLVATTAPASASSASS